MALLDEIWRRLKALFRPHQIAADLEEEMRLHMDLRAQQHAESGTSPDEARYAAQRQFGNTLQLKEAGRDVWGWASLERLFQDLRYGWRTLRKNPLFAAMAVLSLALGIGANTAIFSFMDAILMRGLPVHHPGELVILNWHTKDFPAVVHGMHGSWYNDPQIGWNSGDYPFPAFELLRTSNSALSSMFGFADAGRLNLNVQGQADLVDGELVSGNFFSSLGVRPAAGRLITEEDDRAGATPVVVISHNYWRRRFAEGNDAIGRSILLNRTTFRIAGVCAPDFSGVNPADAPDLFIPLHAAPLLAEDPQDDAQGRFFDKNFYWLEIMGRLRPGTSIRGAQADLAARFALRQQHSFHRGRESRSTCARARGWRLGQRPLATRVFQAAPHPDGHGRSHSGYCLRQYRQPSANARCGAPT
jgi:macrolide transport system ATP-binding/permease protein